MRIRIRCQGWVVGVAAFLIAPFMVATAPAQGDLRAEADSMNAKITRIEEAAKRQRPRTAAPLRTSFTDREANAYLNLYGATFLPAGITNPSVTAGDNGSVMARAIVDLDAVSRSRERSLLDPLRFATGALEVVAMGSVSGADGWGVVRFHSATVAGVAVPKGVAQELLRFYTRTAERPNGFEFDKPFELPAGGRSVIVERGRTTITQ